MTTIGVFKMNTKKPRDPLYPGGFEETKELKKQINISFVTKSLYDD